MSKYDVYVPMTIDALRPSATQAYLLAEIKDGAQLVGRFDIWGGYDWSLVRENGMTSNVTRATVQGLLNRGLITKGASVSVFSGRQETPFTLSANQI